MAEESARLKEELEVLKEENLRWEEVFVSDFLHVTIGLFFSLAVVYIYGIQPFRLNPFPLSP